MMEFPRSIPGKVRKSLIGSDHTARCIQPVERNRHTWIRMDIGHLQYARRGTGKKLKPCSSLNQNIVLAFKAQ